MKALVEETNSETLGVNVNAAAESKASTHGWQRR